MLSTIGSLAGAVLGGRTSARSIAREVTGALSKGGHTSRTEQRKATAQHRVDEKEADLADLEADLAEELVEIDDRWAAAAADVTTLEVGLEKTDITVDEVVLLWVPIPE